MSLERFQWLRDEFLDRIPDEVLHSYGDFKVRRNWWNCLTAFLELGLSNGVIPEELRPEVESFLDGYTSEAFHAQPLTTEVDIERANNLLDRILGMGN